MDSILAAVGLFLVVGVLVLLFLWQKHCAKQESGSSEKVKQAVEDIMNI